MGDFGFRSFRYLREGHELLPRFLRFGGTTSWEQYRQVFDAIVLSNGWSDATAALQLLSHLEGDA